jgi:small nuclear ribonucleoprotein (snRNP)-like protein
VASSVTRFAPWRWPVSVHHRLVRIEERNNEIANQVGHLTSVANTMNHVLQDLSQRMSDQRADAETIAALALTFRRYAADITAHLDEVLAAMPTAEIQSSSESASDNNQGRKAS